MSSASSINCTPGNKPLPLIGSEPGVPALRGPIAPNYPTCIPPSATADILPPLAHLPLTADTDHATSATAGLPSTIRDSTMNTPGLAPSDSNLSFGDSPTYSLTLFPLSFVYRAQFPSQCYTFSFKIRLYFFPNFFLTGQDMLARKSVSLPGFRVFQGFFGNLYR